MNTRYVTIGGIAVAVGLLGSVAGFWPTVGWETPTGHEADIAELEEKHQRADSEVQRFRNEWKCDEWDEELFVLLSRREAGENGLTLRREIEKKREAMDKLNCAQFEDF